MSKILGFHCGDVENVVFRDVTPCDSCKDGRFRGTYRLNHQGKKNRPARNNPDYVGSTFLRSLVLTRATRLNISEDAILYRN
jgi:hypothetical protein